MKKLMPRFKKSVEFASNWIFWIFYIIAVGITVAVIVTIANYFLNQAAEIPSGAEESTIIPRFYSLAECFAYQDAAGKVHQGTIDLEKFEQKNMNNCFPQQDSKFAFFMVIEPEVSGFDAKSVKTFNWVEGTASREIVDNVLVLSNGQKISAKLRIKIKNV